MRPRFHIVPLAILLLAPLACSDDPLISIPGDDFEIPHEPVELLVERYSRSGARSFYTMAMDGSFVLPFVAPPGARQLIPSPDGRLIAFLRDVDDLIHLWRMDRDGGDQRALLDGEIIVNSADWSRDGTRLAIQYNTLTVSDNIAVLAPDGSGFVDLTPDPLPATIQDRSPVWSPNGTRIAFTSNRSGITRLWTMTASGGSPAQIVPTATLGTHRTPAWSPDGSWIAFVSVGGTGGTGIAIVHPDGTGFRLFPVAGDVGRPSWTPDNEILYTTNPSATGGHYDVYLLDPTTGATVRLTDHSDHDFRAVPLPFVEPERPWLGFDAPVVYPTNRPDPPGIGAGDVTGDSVPDLMLLAPGMEEVRFLRGTGDGLFQPVGSVVGPGDQRELAIAEVSRDLIADLIVSSDSALVVWRGSAGGIGLPTTYEIPGDIESFTTFDFDRDGWTEIATIYTAGAETRLRIHGTRFDGELIANLDAAIDIENAVGVCAADVTGEGNGDLVVLTTAPESPVVIMRGRGDVSFDAPAVVATDVLVTDETIPVCADLSGDRRADLALLRPGADGGLRVLLFAGPTFAAGTPVSVRGSGIAAADFDRDGDLDLLVADPSRTRVHFARNRGDGRFATPSAVAEGGAPTRLAVMDLSGDGWPDAAVANADGSIEVYLNRRR